MIYKKMGFALTVAGLLAVCQCSFAQNGKSKQDIEFYQLARAAYDSWLQNITFRIQYELESGTAQSLDSAFNDEFEGKLKYKGVLFKDSDIVRISRNFPGRPTSKRINDKMMSVSGEPRDEIATESLHLDMSSFSGVPKDSVVRLVGRNETGIRITFPDLANAEITPLLMFPEAFRHPLVLSKIDDENRNSTVQAERQGELIIVKIDGESGGARMQKTINLDTSYSVPLITEIALKSELPNGDEYNGVSRAMEIVETKNGPVAKRIRFASKSGTRKARVKEWRAVSFDETPEDSDFVLQVPDGAQILGLKSPPVGENRMIKLSELDENDLFVPRSPQAPAHPNDGLTSWISVIVGLVSVALIVVFVRKGEK